jgi:hypothetical protein
MTSRETSEYRWWWGGRITAVGHCRMATDIGIADRTP